MDADLDARRQSVVGVLNELHDGYYVAGHPIPAEGGQSPGVEPER